MPRHDFTEEPTVPLRRLDHEAMPKCERPRRVMSLRDPRPAWEAVMWVVVLVPWAVGMWTLLAWAMGW